MDVGLVLPVKLAEQIESILEDLCRRTGAEHVLLADISGQLISAQGKMAGASSQMQKFDPVLVAALAASDAAAMTELTRQIGEENPHGSFLHEGENKSVYLFNVAGSFVLIVVFRANTPIGLIRLFVRRAAERMYPLTAEFEDYMGPPRPVPNMEFSGTLMKELDKVFKGL